MQDSQPIFSGTLSSPKSSSMPFSWPTSLPNPIPHRYRRKLRSKLRSRQSPASSISALQTSFSPSDTIKSLRAHRWSYYDGQYLVLILIAMFALSIAETPGPGMKMAAVSGLMVALLMPVTRQFFLPFLPILSWLVFFFSCRFIPNEWRPPIWVRVLPALENIFYGANLSNILSAHKHWTLDLFAWLPYGIMHYGTPAFCTLVLFFFAAPGTAPLYARSYGFVNLCGVAIQMAFPCSPPWYENLYGLVPANYSVKGSPAGLQRVDELFGIDLYTSTFTASPLVFGAFPSLHAGSAVLSALFMIAAFPKLRGLFIFYCMWLWWATMYLSHHYAVDLVGGSIIAAIAFYIAKTNFLPRRQPGKTWRWDYDYVEIGDAPSSGYEYGLADFRHARGGSSSDEWTVGSSSSVSSGSMSPVDESNSLWEGETLASQGSDNEYAPPNR